MLPLRQKETEWVTGLYGVGEVASREGLWSPQGTLPCIGAGKMPPAHSHQEF